MQFPGSYLLLAFFSPEFRLLPDRDLPDGTRDPPVHAVLMSTTLLWRKVSKVLKIEGFCEAPHIGPDVTECGGLHWDNPRLRRDIPSKLRMVNPEATEIPRNSFLKARSPQDLLGFLNFYPKIASFQSFRRSIWVQNSPWSVLYTF